jgi:DNA repair ATPase RecN
MKTAAQILDEAHTGVYINKAIVGEAMQTYATQQTSDLSTQLAKANSDKEKLGELLKLMSHSYNQSGEVVKKIKQTLQDCGITF